MNVGDLVICRCTFDKYQDMFPFDVTTPQANKIYTIRKVFTMGAFNGIVLDEIYNQMLITPEFGPMEVQFESTCFDVIPSADISQLKKLL